MTVDAFGAVLVRLEPAAFQDEETLVRTLGHESVHVVQHQQGRITTVTGPLEDEAYAAEDGFVATRRGTPVMTRLIVENVQRTSSRPWAFVTGRLEGDELHIGDELTVTHGNIQVATAVVRSIELHSAPERTTIALDADLADTIQSGTVLIQAT